MNFITGDKAPPKSPGKWKKGVIYFMVLAVVLILGAIGIKKYPADTREPAAPHEPPPAGADAVEPPRPAAEKVWDGPVLYAEQDSEPLYLLMVEKAVQKMYLYRYDGRYRLVKSFECATGERRGKKRREKDEKTPEGIYFNNKTFRDSKVTIFGDRAFGLNYPDAFDVFEGNQGNGIFIHGSNKTIAPFSTNGCVVLNNSDLSALDRSVPLDRTPVIIGSRLPYRFDSTNRDLSELIPFLKKAMVPEQYAHLKSEVRDLKVLGFEDRVVAFGQVRVEAAGGVSGRSKLYLADPGKNLLVLLRREWDEEKAGKAAVQAKPRPEPGKKPRIAELVESWRRTWEKKQLDAYIAHYHPAFESGGKNLSAWRRHKRKLNGRYRSISVKLSDIKVKIDGNRAWAYFRQHYRSDAFSAERYKRLEFKKNRGDWKILRERAFRYKQADWPA